jgi:hypothetical protein
LLIRHFASDRRPFTSATWRFTHGLTLARSDSSSAVTSDSFIHSFGSVAQNRLTNRWSQPLADAMRTSDFMKQLFVFVMLPAASGGTASSR